MAMSELLCGLPVVRDSSYTIVCAIIGRQKKRFEAGKGAHMTVHNHQLLAHTYLDRYLQDRARDEPAAGLIQVLPPERLTLPAESIMTLV
jgi:hypothetical protein